MQAQISLSIKQVHELLLHVAITRPVFIWGPPGIGKSSLVEQFAQQLGLECVALLGSQLAPEDLIGIPKIDGGVSRFYPPSMIVREREFVLFIDELNIASQEIQKAFYSLILDKRIGEYRLPRVQSSSVPAIAPMTWRSPSRCPVHWSTGWCMCI